VPKCTSACLAEAWAEQVHNARVPRGRRVRGLLLRIVLNRPIAIVVGAAVAFPAVMLLVNQYAWETGATDGLALLALATGIALMWGGVTGRQPDWID
jgi:hypothetical protein